jgi:hypothetical protein
MLKKVIIFAFNQRNFASKTIKFGVFAVLLGEIIHLSCAVVKRILTQVN